MSDHVPLGLRAHNLQECLVHDVADATGAYPAQGLDVTLVSDGPTTGLSVGVASALYEVATGTEAWDILLVTSTAPLFWIAAQPVDPVFAVPVNPTIAFLLRLASVGQPRGDVPVVGPAAVGDVATGRLPVAVDIGATSAFPAMGIAGRRGRYDPGVARRVVHAHVAALDHLRRDPAPVRRLVVERHGVAAADLDDVLATLRSRFRVVPPADAALAATRGAQLLDLDAAGVAAAFAAVTEARSWN